MSEAKSRRSSMKLGGAWRDSMTGKLEEAEDRGDEFVGRWEN